MKVKLFTMALLTILLLVTLVPPGTVPVYSNENRVEMPGSGWDPLGGQNATGVFTRVGQRLTIPDREVNLIGYRLIRVGNATGDVFISMYDSATKEVIVKKAWGDASELPIKSSGYSEVTLDPPIKVNREVIICAEYYSGTATDYVMGAYYSGDRVPGESYINYYRYGQWHDIGEAEEGSYCYEYVGEGGNGSGSSNDNDNSNEPVPSGFKIPIIATVGVVTLVIVIEVRKRKQKKEGND